MRKFLLMGSTALALAAVSSMALANLTNAPRTEHVEFIYYKSGQEVGGKMFKCNGGFMQWGTVNTKEVMVFHSPCP